MLYVIMELRHCMSSSSRSVVNPIKCRERETTLPLSYTPYIRAFVRVYLCFCFCLNVSYVLCVYVALFRCGFVLYCHFNGFSLESHRFDVWTQGISFWVPHWRMSYTENVIKSSVKPIPFALSTSLVWYLIPLNRNMLLFRHVYAQYTSEIPI